MRWKRYLATIAMLSILMLMLSMSASAVNSFCTTGPKGEWGNKLWLRPAVKQCNNELDDHYPNGDHIRVLGGRYPSHMVMTVQEFQPQHFIYVAHGTKTYPGEYTKAGLDTDKKDSKAFQWPHGLVTVSNQIRNSPVPFGAVVYVGCYTGYYKANDGSVQNKEAWSDDLYSWIFIGTQGKPKVTQAGPFAKTYADKVTDGKLNYYRAAQAAVNKADVAITFSYQSSWGTPLHHSSYVDVYRNIRSSLYTGTTLKNRGDEWALTYDRDSTHFWGSNKKITNGVYFVIHGNVNDNKNQFGSDVDLEVVVRKKISGQYSYTTYNYNGLDNTQATYDNKCYRGGSTIVSQLLDASTIKDATEIKLFIEFKSSSVATKFRITRTEMMEIGKNP